MAEVKAIKERNEQVDWFSLAKQYGPDVDALDLSFIHESLLVNPQQFNEPPPSSIDITKQSKPAEVAFKFTPEIDRQIADLLYYAKGRSASEQQLHLIHPDLTVSQARRRFLRLKETFTDADLQELSQLASDGLTIKQIAKRMKKSPGMCELQLNKLKWPTDQSATSAAVAAGGKSSIRGDMYSLMAEEKNQLSKLPKSMVVLLRRQFKVIGSDRERLSELFQIPKTQVSHTLARANQLWQTVNTTSDALNTRYNRCWTSKEISMLKDTVEEMLKTNDGLIDWLAVGSKLNRLPEMCKNQYRMLKNNFRKGRYAGEEDDVLMQCFAKYRNDWTQYNQHMLAQRASSSIRRRLGTIFHQFLKKKQPGLHLCLKYNIAHNDIEKFADNK